MVAGIVGREDTTTVGRLASPSAAASAQPLFRGFAETMIPAEEIAVAVGVALPIVEGWRHGRVEVPAAKLALLTLLLAGRLEELEASDADGGDGTASPWEPGAGLAT